MTDKYSVFIENRHVQHAEADWTADYAPWYYTHLIPKTVILKDLVAFASGDSLQPKGRKRRQLIDVQEDSIPEPLREIEVADWKEIGEKVNEDSNGGRADSVAGEWIGSGMGDIQDE